MNLIAAHLNLRLGPALLSSESDIQVMITQITQTPFNKVQRSNYKSVLRKYVAMVRSNYEGAFDDIIPVGIDVVANGLPERMRIEISRIVRDSKMARDLKARYDGQCQLCGGRLEISKGEFYLEAHHLRPLGRPHNGTDDVKNMICVCPNCHARLDFSAQKLDVKTLKVSLHEIGAEFIRFHNGLCG